MKKTILTALFTMSAILSYSQKTATVSGTVQNLKENEVLLFQKKEDLKDLEKPDTIKITNGKFNFTCEVETIATGKITIIDKVEAAKIKSGGMSSFTMIGRRPGWLTLFLFPGSAVTMEIDANQFPNTKLGGDVAINKDMNSFLACTVGSTMEYAMVNDQIKEEGSSEALLKKRNDMVSLIGNQKREWIESNRDNEYAMYQFIYTFSPEKSGAALMEEFKLFSTRAQNSFYGKRGKKEIENMMRTDLGVKVPDFKLKEVMSGKDISLSDYKGRYVILNFWSSKVRDMQMTIRELKSLYALYKEENFDILSVGNFNTDDVIKDYVTEREIEWKQVRSTIKNGKKSLTELYGITAYPTYILLDPNGIVIAKDNNIPAKLKSLFK